MMRCLITFILLYLIDSVKADSAVAEYHIEKSNKFPCTYFESSRFAVGVEGLINCTWYAPKACCKRTEVTSVFSGMPPLYGASRECTNHMNYMMCYFCAPDQVNWYHKDKDRKVHVCTDFCKSVYHHCQEALFEGTRIGDIYQNGTSLCEAQNYHVIDGKQNCFKFDRSVFDHGNKINSIKTWLVVLMLTFGRYWTLV
ncbi:uncharacterized protein LOC111133518 isoform X2 [Crassostrea virginica]